MAVKSIFLNIGLHLARDEIPHRLPPFDQLPYLCRRDIQNGDVFKVEGMTRRMDPTLDLLIISENRDQGLWKWRVGIDSYRGGKGLLESGSGHHNEVTKGEEVLKFFPGLNLHKRIPSQDEKEDIRMPLPEIPDRIDRVRFFRS
jgi:hypothetical protein